MYATAEKMCVIAGKICAIAEKTYATAEKTAGMPCIRVVFSTDWKISATEEKMYGIAGKMCVTAEKTFVTAEKTAGIAASEDELLFLIHPFYINRPRHSAGFIVLIAIASHPSTSSG